MNKSPAQAALCGESPNSRTPGSCLSKSERPRGREPEAVPQGPQESRIDVWSVLGVPKGLGYLQEIFATNYQELSTTEAT